MINKQKLRLLVQISYLFITLMSAFIDLRWTMSIILISMILGGTYYCGWACPFGTLQELMNKLAKYIKIKQRKIPRYIHKHLKYTRYIILLSITLLTSSIIFSIMSFEPRNSVLELLTGKFPTILSAVTIGVFLLSSLFYERLYCSYFCSEGAKYGLIGSIRAFTIHRDDDNCISCNKCNKACPMNIDVSKCKTLRSAQCINCFECVDACPIENVLSYKLIRFDKRTIVIYFLLMVILIPGFLVKKSVETVSDQTNPSTLPITSADIEITSIDDQDISSTSDSVILSSSSSETLYSDGVYTGVGNGFRGSIYVEVTIENDVIVNVLVTQHQDDRKWYNRAYDTIRSRIIDSQSTDVDLVSGATYTSEGIRDAVANALEKAK
ncbi:MAG: 4Fe-4S binding protein [Clostridiales bacterium]|nr:4Fe-4S binding protein [Clostridiales bacterium]